MKKKIAMFAFVMFLLFPLVSSATSKSFTPDISRISEYEKEIPEQFKTNYGTYTIEKGYWFDVFNWFKQDTLREIDLEENTEVCSDDCLAIGNVNNLKEGKIFDSIKFKRSFDDGLTFVDWNGFTNWKLYIEEDVERFETICDEIIKEGQRETGNETNQTEYDCHEESLGLFKEWKIYDFDKDYSIGNYKYKLVGSKKGSVVYDWVLVSNGQHLTKWAIWGSIEEIYECYQESANVSNQTGIDGDCGLNYGGSYLLNGVDNNAIDGDWDTFSELSSNNYINYSKPKGVKGAIWKVKVNQSLYDIIITSNITIPNSCLTQDILQLRVSKSFQGGASPTRFYCFNESYVEILEIPGSVSYPNTLFEEAVIWNVSAEAEVILNSPVDNSIAMENPVTFNATANVTGGAHLVNMSLWTNTSGSWVMSNTSFIPINDAGLVSYYKLDETSGTTAYDALGVYNGTNNGATPNVAGKINTAYDFDGSNDKITIGDADSFDINNNNFSINLWINPETWTGTVGIISKSVNIDSKKGWVLYRDSISNKLQFRLNDGSLKSAIFTSSSISSGSWTMVSIVYSDTNSNILLYENGTYIQTVSLSGGDCRTTADITLGFADTWDAYFNGLIDEVGIWNRALTPTEITELYNSGAGLRPFESRDYTFTWEKEITGSTLWNVYACDSDGDCGYSPANYTVNLDDTIPTIEINDNPVVMDLNQNHTVNFTVTDVNLDNVWLEYMEWMELDYDGTKINISKREMVTEGEYEVWIARDRPISTFGGEEGDSGGRTIIAYGGTLNVSCYPAKYVYNVINGCSMEGGIKGYIIAYNETNEYRIDIDTTGEVPRFGWGEKYPPVNPIISGEPNSFSFPIEREIENFTIYANDTVGNIGQLGGTLTFDDIAPNITITEGDGLLNYGNLIENHRINFTVTDENLNLSSIIKFEYNGTNLTNTISTPWSYTNWASQEPNDANEDCLEFLTSDKWNDAKCDMSKYGLCQYNNWTHFKTPTAMTWQQAKEYCETQGAHLAVIPNATINSQAYSVGGYPTWLGGFQPADFPEPPYYEGWQWINYSAEGLVENDDGSYSISFPLVKDLYEAKIYAEDLVGNKVIKNINWSYKIFEVGRTFNPETFETKDETFTITIDSDDLRDAKLVYHGYEYPSTGTNIRTVTHNIDPIPSQGNREFYWKVRYDGEWIDTYPSTQLTKTFDIGYTGDKPYVQINIRDEYDNSIINSTTIRPLVDYYIDDKGFVKTFHEAKEADGQYTIYATPNVESWGANGEIYYYADGYQPRYYFIDEEFYSNSSIITKDLYLSMQTDNILVRYRVVNRAGQPIEGVRITAKKRVGPDYILVEQTLTDDNGEASIFLNPDYYHRIEITKDSCEMIMKERRVTSSETTQEVLTCEGDGGSAYEDLYNPPVDPTDIDKFSYKLLPDSSLLIMGKNTFRAEVSDPRCRFSSITLEIYNGTQLLNSKTKEVTCNGFVETTLNVTEEKLKAVFTFVHKGKEESFSRIYSFVGEGNWADMPNILDTLKKMPDLGKWGLSDKTKTLLALIGLFLLLSLLGMTEQFKSEYVATTWFIFAYLLLVSFFGWVNLSIFENKIIDGVVHIHVINQWGLAFISGLIAAGVTSLKSKQ